MSLLTTRAISSLARNLFFTRLNKLLILLVMTIVLPACERAADISSPVEYQKQGIKFSYPQNWTVTEDNENDGERHLFIESPGDAIMIIKIYSKIDAVPLKEFAEWFSSDAEDEIPLVNFDKSLFTETTTQTQQGKLKGIKENLSINFLSEKIPHSREYFSYTNNNKVAFLISQAATEDIKKVAPGFNLIFKTFAFE